MNPVPPIQGVPPPIPLPAFNACAPALGPPSPPNGEVEAGNESDVRGKGVVEAGLDGMEKGRGDGPVPAPEPRKLGLNSWPLAFGPAVEPVAKDGGGASGSCDPPGVCDAWAGTEDGLGKGEKDGKGKGEDVGGKGEVISLGSLIPAVM